MSCFLIKFNKRKILEFNIANDGGGILDVSIWDIYYDFPDHLWRITTLNC